MCLPNIHKYSAADGSGLQGQGERRDYKKKDDNGSKSPNSGSGFDKGEDGIVPLKETEKGAKEVWEMVFDVENNSGSAPSFLLPEKTMARPQVQGLLAMAK